MTKTNSNIKRYILPKIFKLMSGEDELIITDEGH